MATGELRESHLLMATYIDLGICIALDRTPPLWLTTCGGVFGIVAHFANVLKDIDEDRKMGIRGLPQRLGTRKSIFIASICLVIISTIISSYQSNLIPWFLFSIPFAMA